MRPDWDVESDVRHRRSELGDPDLSAHRANWKDSSAFLFNALVVFNIRHQIVTCIFGQADHWVAAYQDVCGAGQNNTMRCGA